MAKHRYGVKGERESYRIASNMAAADRKFVGAVGVVPAAMLTGKLTGSTWKQEGARVNKIARNLQKSPIKRAIFGVVFGDK